MPVSTPKYKNLFCQTLKKQVLIRGFLLYLIHPFTHFDEPKNSLELLNPTRNIRICSTKLITITSGEINLQSKQDIICHVAKLKPATSAHYLADVIPFLAYVIFPSNPTLR